MYLEIKHCQIFVEAPQTDSEADFCTIAEVTTALLAAVHLAVPVLQRWASHVILCPGAS